MAAFDIDSWMTLQLKDGKSQSFRVDAFADKWDPGKKTWASDDAESKQPIDLFDLVDRIAKQRSMVFKKEPTVATELLKDAAAKKTVLDQIKCIFTMFYNIPKQTVGGKLGEQIKETEKSTGMSIQPRMLYARKGLVLTSVQVKAIDAQSTHDLLTVAAKSATVLASCSHSYVMSGSWVEYGVPDWAITGENFAELTKPCRY